MGSLLADLVTGMGLGEEAAVTPEYFASIGDYLAELMISEVLTDSTLPTLTNRAWLSFLPQSRVQERV